MFTLPTRWLYLGQWILRIQPKTLHCTSTNICHHVIIVCVFCQGHIFVTHNAKRETTWMSQIYLLPSGFSLNSLFDGKLETIDTSENVFWCINKLICIWKHARCNTSVVSPHNVFSVYLHVEQKKKDRYFYDQLQMMEQLKLKRLSSDV